MTAKTAPKVTLWEFFQQLGKTFMLPVLLVSCLSCSVSPSRWAWHAKIKA